MKFGEKLRKSRIEKGLSQTQLAEITGINRNTIVNYESGKTYPRNREIYTTLAAILGVDPDYLHNENEDFVSEAGARYGSRGAKQAQELVAELAGLFAGGELAEEDMDAMARAVQEAYWDAKERNRKYAPKKFRND